MGGLFEPDKQNKIAVQQIRKMVINTSKGVKNSMLGIARNFETNAKELIKNPPKSGRFYRLKVNGQTRLIQASAPGEAPANRTDNLRQNVSRLVSKNEIEFGVQNVVYARRLELGDSKVQPRPYLIKAINNESKNAFVILKARIAEALVKK